MSDFYQYETSSASQGGDETPYTSKTWVYVNDTNQGAYGSNKISFDLSSLYNSQKFIAVNEMELQVPLIMVLSKESGTAGQLGQNDFAMAMKNGYYNIIDSMNIVYSDQTVQQQCLHSNFYTSFKMISTMCVDDLHNIAPSLGFYPDNPTSWSYTRNPSSKGIGLCNNVAFPSFPANLGVQAVGDTFNDGLTKRQKRTSVSASKFVDLTSENTLRANMRNYTKYEAGTAGAVNTNSYQVWYFVATIKLAHISSFFEKMPLTRGFYARLDLNMNMGSLRITSPANSSDMSLVQGNAQFPFQTCPFMITECKTGNGTFVTPDTTTTLTAGIYIAKVTASVNSTPNHSELRINDHPMGICRLYAPMVEMKPDLAINYIQNNRDKYVEYNDIQYASLVNQEVDKQINFNITNSAVDPVELLIVPMISASANGLVGGVGISPQTSPFTCEPACTSPVGLSQFNVQLAGVNVYSNNVSYDFEQFQHELLGINSINGASSLGLSSGLIDQVGFENIYKYYYVNLERRASNKNVPISISITCTNSNLVPIDLHIFVVSRKSLILDVDSGKMKASSQ